MLREMKKLNYPELLQKIEARNQDYQTLAKAKAKEKEENRVPLRIDSKTIVFTKTTRNQVTSSSL